MDRLTPEQEALIPIWRARYYAAAVSTERADRVRAEAAFARAYRIIGRDPVPVHWVASPAAAAKIRINLYSSLITVLGNSLRNRLRRSLYTRLRNSLWISLWNNNSLYSSIYSGLFRDIRNLRIAWCWFDLHWIAYYKFAADVMGVQYEPDDADKLDIMHEIGLSCGFWYPRQDMIVACERPTITLVDDRLRLHCETGPAVAFADGFSIHAIHGVRVPADVIEKPITVDQINAERNSEIQRLMLERFGWDRYVTETKIEVIDHDERWGTLMRSTAGLLLRVTNRSPEPDGSFRQYILPVSAQCEPLPDPNDQNGRLGEPQNLTALNAVASTFGMRGEDYGLLQDES